MKTAFALVFAAVFLIISAQAWWDTPHELVAAMAQYLLNDSPDATSETQVYYARANEIILTLNPLCDNRTQKWIESAVWPDDIKKS